MYGQKDKLRHYLGKGNFELKARVARQLIDLLQAKEALSDFRIRVDYNATPQGKLLGRPGDIIVTLPPASFEDSYLVTTVHSAIILECLPGAQPVSLLTENEAFLQLPFVYTVPTIGKYSKREERAVREAYTLPWCPIDEDGADRLVGREYSVPLERGVATVRRLFPEATNLTTSIALKDSTDEVAIGRLLDSNDVLVSNTLDVFAGLKDLPNRKPMQIDLLMVWPVLVTEIDPLIVRDTGGEAEVADRLAWWAPVDSTGFAATSGIQPSSSAFDAGPGIILTVIGSASLGSFVDAVDELLGRLRKRFGRMRLVDLYS